MLTEWLDLNRQFQSIVGDPQPGDLLCFRVEQIIHHTGLHVGGHRFVHARRYRGVMSSTLRDSTYESRLVTIYRPLARNP
jgi:cell wall-associated NlpC family hydrolase